MYRLLLQIPQVWDPAARAGEAESGRGRQRAARVDDRRAPRVDDVVRRVTRVGPLAQGPHILGLVVGGDDDRQLLLGGGPGAIWGAPTPRPSRVSDGTPGYFTVILRRSPRNSVPQEMDSIEGV